LAPWSSFVAKGNPSWPLQSLPFCSIYFWSPSAPGAYTNLSCFLILGGLLAWIMFMMAGLAIAPQAPIPDNFSLIMFTMPAATWIGALLQMLANLLFRGCAAEVEVQQCCHTGDTTRWTNSRDERI
jgi:hypothetical protein